MSQTIHEIRHGLTLEQATRAAHLALDEYLSRFAERGLSGQWSTDTRAELAFATAGVHLNAVVDVTPDVLRVEAQVPLMLRPFKAKAIAAVDREAQKWIDKVKAEANG
jgi:hypothetical protein